MAHEPVTDKFIRELNDVVNNEEGEILIGHCTVVTALVLVDLARLMEESLVKLDQINTTLIEFPGPPPIE